MVSVLSLHTVLRRAAAAVLLLAAVALPAWAETAPNPLSIAGPQGLALQVHWYPLKDARGPQPVVIAFHGCAGLYRSDSVTFDERYPDYIKYLHERGYAVLLPDSFTSRGSGSICEIAARDRTINVETRREDVISAIAWLKSRSDVDGKRIALLGWSHGAMTVLSALNTQREPHAQGIAGAAVFYPGCSELLRRGYGLQVPLLMQLGALDDWTAPAPCEKLVAQLTAQPGSDVTLRIYPDSYHGFDSRTPARFRMGVPNGTNPGGVHVGGNRKARAQSLDELDRFLKRILQ